MKIYIYVLFFIMTSCSHFTVFQKEKSIHPDTKQAKNLQESVKLSELAKTKVKIGHRSDKEKRNDDHLILEEEHVNNHSDKEKEDDYLILEEEHVNNHSDKEKENDDHLILEEKHVNNDPLIEEIKHVDHSLNEISAPELEYDISVPHTYQNLTVYLLHGENTINVKNVITLEEAMKNGQVTVRETRIVRKLTIENLGDSPIYVHAGDLLKGGKQDRTIAHDTIVLPNSGEKTINTFCVESGRWSKRNDESEITFHSNNHQVASKKLKLAVKYSRNQGKVWKEVNNLQQKLSSNLGASVRSNISKSSMQLTMENKLINNKVQNYIDALHDVIHNRNDSIGFVSVVNGKISQVDIYGSHNLFLKLWKKLLYSCSVEALSQETVAHKIPSILTVNKWLQKMRSGKRKEVKIGTSTQLVYQSEDSIGEDSFCGDDFGDDSGDLLHSSFSDFSEEDESLVSDEWGESDELDEPHESGEWDWSEDEEYDEDDEEYQRWLMINSEEQEEEEFIYSKDMDEEEDF